MSEQELSNKSHFLPEHEVKAFLTVSKLQVFESQGVELLDQVSEAIKAPDASKTRTVSSIPTIFARPLLFKMALFDPNHPLHSEITDEWRGLISCFILSHLLPLDIKCEEVSYNEKSKFFRGYKELIPKVPLKLGRNEPGSKVEYSWSEPFVIRINDKIGDNVKRMIVGGTSPYTLFYTSPNYTEAAKSLATKGFPTRKKPNEDITVFSQPYTDEHILIVKKWLDQMIGDSGRLKNAFSDEDDVQIYKRDILDLFSKWQTDLQKIIDERSLNSTEPVKDLNVLVEGESTPFPFPLADYKLYRLASSPMIAKQVGANSDIFLKATNLTESRIVVCDETLNIAGDLVIYNSLKKSTIGDWRNLFKGASGDSIGSQKLPDGVKWIVPGRYFLSNELIAVRSEVPFTKSLGSEIPTDGTGYIITGGDRFVLPFNREFLDLFTSSQDIIDILSPAFEMKNGNIEFSFTLKIQYLGKLVDVRVKKEYAYKPNDEEGQIIEVDGPPLLAFWPHFYHEKWNRYFIYKRKIVKNGELEFDFEPYSFVHGMPEIKDSAEYINYDVTEIDRFPEAMIVKYRSHPVGSILISKGQQGDAKLDRYSVQDNGKDINFGVDFGTSNTNLWFKQGNEVSPSVLKVGVMPRVLTETNFSATVDNLATTFFAYEEPNIPFATVVKKLIPNAKRPIFDGVIQFVTDPNIDNSDDLLETNIKWGGDDWSIRDLFVEHMLLILCAEARKRGAAKININVSYPLTYSDMMRSTYISTFNNLIEQKFNWYGGEKCITVNDEARGLSVDAYTESVAVGKYFKAKGSNIMSAVCVDVGGGTSDISIWDSNSIIYQSSLYMAGNVVSSSFRKSKTLRQIVFRDLDEMQDALVNILSKNIKNENVSEEDSFFATTFNLLLKKYGKSIDRRLPNLFNDPIFNQFRTILIVEFAAIVYYCGMIIQKLRQQSNRPLKAMPNIYWAGGASSFIKWIDYGSEMLPKSTSHIIFSEILKSFYYTNEEKNASGFKPSPSDCILTDKPKSECASGLLLDATTIGDSIASGSAIIGENIRLNSSQGSIVQYTSELNSKPANKVANNRVYNPEEAEEAPQEDEDPGEKFYREFHGFVAVKNGIEEPTEPGVKFNGFINLLNMFGRDFGIMQPIRLADYQFLNKNIMTRIRESALKASMDKGDGTQGKTVRVEPIFIIEVKELIKEMIKKLP